MGINTNGVISVSEEDYYNQNYIDETICRLDFVTPIEEFNSKMPKEIFKIVYKYYPIAEPTDIIGGEFGINPLTGATYNQITTKQWTFWARNRKNSCKIERTDVIFSIRNYSTFDEFRNSVVDILEEIMRIFPENQGKRFGLRYINSIPFKEHPDWIQEEYSSPFKNRDENTTRFLTTHEYVREKTDLKVILRYGFKNPDYPAIMKKEDFLIDVDSYSTGIIYREDIRDLIDDMHSEDKNCFEKMITDSFRSDN